MSRIASSILKGAVALSMLIIDAGRVPPNSVCAIKVSIHSFLLSLFGLISYPLTTIFPLTNVSEGFGGQKSSGADFEFMTIDPSVDSYEVVRTRKSLGAVGQTPLNRIRRSEVRSSTLMSNYRDI